MTKNINSDRTFTEAEIKEVNEIVAELQKSISMVENSVKSKDFNDALKNIVVGIKSTNCPVCKEKLLLLSADIIKTQKECKSNSGQCDIMINSTVKKAEDMREEFIPIATEKNVARSKKDIFNIPSAQSILNEINAEKENV